jgi:hypothetical protein
MADRHEPARPEWDNYLEQLTKDHQDDAVTIEVVGLDHGDSSRRRGCAFAYIEYDDKDDTVVVGAGGKDSRLPVVLRHLIEHPQTILADPLAPSVARAFDIVGRDGTSTIVTLRPRDALPPPP